MLAFNMKIWADYLDEGAMKQYGKAGCYTQTLKLKNGTTYDNVKIVALNSQPAYQFNFYLWGERDDPGEIL